MQKDLNMDRQAESMVSSFEDDRWGSREQKIEFRHKTAVQLLPEDSTSILDVGCGEGTYLNMAKLKIPDSVLCGADMSNVGLEIAKKKNPSAKFIHLNGSNKLPFDDDSYDVVVALDVLEHTFEPTVLLREMTRVSKKIVIISVPNFSSLPARLQVLFGNVPENNKPNKGHVYWYNQEVVYSVMQSAGLRADVQVCNFQGEYLPLLGPIIRFIGSRLPNLFALSFVIKAIK
jgi:ubiquinone/menaquinone biosynthesis C-methylase UbiE